MRASRSTLRAGAFWLACLLVASSAQGAEPTLKLKKLLDLSLEDLMNTVVVTTVSKVPEKLKDAPATVRVITAKQIHERGYLTLQEALADLPGLQFRNIQGFNSYVFMRGVPSQNNLIQVLVDGVQINELQSGGFYGGGQYNLGNVERIEVVYGPASVLYGTHAVSGIVNIITKAPKDLDGTRASVLLGQLGTQLYDFSTGYHDADRQRGASLSGRLAKTQMAELGGAAGDGNWSNQMENFDNDVSFDGKVVDGDTTLGFTFQDKNASRATARRTAGTLFEDHDVDWHIRFFNAWAKNVHELDKDLSLHSTLYYRNATVMDDSQPTIQRASGASLGYRERYYRPNEQVGLESQLDWRVATDLNLTGGVVLEREWLAQNFSRSRSLSAELAAPQPVEPPQTRNELTSLYLQGQYQLATHLAATLGLRHDSSSAYGDVNTPRAGLVYNRDRLTAKLLYTEAFRAPRPWDYTDGLGNAALNPEQMKSLELALGLALDDRLRVDLSLFRNKLQGQFAKEAVGPSFRWVNSGSIDTDGLELTLTRKGARTDSYVSYTFNDSNLAGGAPVPEIGQDTANAGLLHRVNSRAKLDLRGQFRGERTNSRLIAATGSDRVGQALVFHSTFSYQADKDLELQLMVKNLLDAEYFDTSDGTTVDRYRQAGRTILLKTTYQF